MNIYKCRSEKTASSKSQDKAVLALYHKILKNAYSDSDYWTLHGDQVLLDLLYDFDEASIIELENDLNNWASNELEILNGAMENDYSDSHYDLLIIRNRLYRATTLLLNPEILDSSIKKIE